MENNQHHSPSKLRSRLLYIGYLILWFVATLIAFMFLFPEQFATIKNRVVETPAEPSQYSESSSDLETGKLHRLHLQMAQSRWPLDVFRFHNTIGYELTPGVSARLRDRSFTSRSHELGFRIPLAQNQHSVEPGGILSIGCSFTYGDNLEAEQAFTFIAADILGLPSYNYGVPSYSYISALLRLEQLLQRGVLDQLQPSAIVLGAGGWLFKRSTNPFYPTSGPQYGYAYLGKDNGKVSIKQAPEQFSLKRQFAFNKLYFPLGHRESEFTRERQALLENITATDAKARALNKQWKTSVTRQELYDFISKRMHKLANSQKIPAVILWMPYHAANANPPEELIDAVNRYENVHLLEGNRAVGDMTQEQKIYRLHPTQQAHRRYGEQIANKLRQLSIETTAAQDEK